MAPQVFHISNGPGFLDFSLSLIYYHCSVPLISADKNVFSKFYDGPNFHPVSFTLNPLITSSPPEGQIIIDFTPSNVTIIIAEVVEMSRELEPWLFKAIVHEVLGEFGEVLKKPVEEPFLVSGKYDPYKRNGRVLFLTKKESKEEYRNFWKLLYPEFCP